MLEKLKEKLVSWSAGKLAEYTNHNDLPLFEDRSTFIQEYDDNGLYVYNRFLVKYYSNDGSIASLSNRFSLNDPKIYDFIYSQSLDTKFKFYNLVDSNTITINSVDYMYLNFASPDGLLGIPFMALDKLTTEYFLHWINQVEFMIKILHNNNYPFPDSVVSITKYIRSPLSGIDYLCPISGPNHWAFTNSCNGFIKDQLVILHQHKQMITVDTGEDKPVYVDWELLKQEAKKSWLSYRSLP